MVITFPPEVLATAESYAAAADAARGRAHHLRHRRRRPRPPRPRGADVQRAPRGDRGRRPRAAPRVPRGRRPPRPAARRRLDEALARRPAPGGRAHRRPPPSPGRGRRRPPRRRQRPPPPAPAGASAAWAAAAPSAPSSPDHRASVRAAIGPDGDADAAAYPRRHGRCCSTGSRSPRWTSTGARGGGQAFAAAVQVGEDAVVGVVTAAGLRGRGGGGFPTGRKWTGIREAGPGRRFAVCNAAEGEPGTFKDRALLRHDPYRVLEGLAIASFAIGAEAAYIATKARYEREAERLADRHRRDRRRRPVRRPHDQPRARARRVPLRRGEGAARGDRGPRSAPPPAAALRARAVRHRRADRLAVRRRARHRRRRRASPTRRW